MTPEEFQPFFWATFNSLPQAARECITQYAQKHVVPNLIINDEAVDAVEKKLGLDWVPAVFDDEGYRWLFAFRILLLDAPVDVFRTIVRHELLHAFYASVHRMPTDDAKRLLGGYQQRVAEKYASEGHQPNADYERMENLIELMNEDCGGDEKAARKWAEENRPI